MNLLHPKSMNITRRKPTSILSACWEPRSCKLIWKRDPKWLVSNRKNDPGGTLTMSNLIVGLSGFAKAIKLVILSSYRCHLDHMFNLFKLFWNDFQGRFQLQTTLKRLHKGSSLFTTFQLTAQPYNPRSSFSGLSHRSPRPHHSWQARTPKSHSQCSITHIHIQTQTYTQQVNNPQASTLCNHKQRPAWSFVFEHLTH